MKSVGEVVDVVVEHHAPFGVFVDMDGEHNALIEMVNMGSPVARGMPPIGMKLRAVLVGIRKNGQYSLALRQTDFAHFGHESDWQDWTQI
jgi:predicted RNA-binding protein with RPS1 domain